MKLMRGRSRFSLEFDVSISALDHIHDIAIHGIEYNTVLLLPIVITIVHDCEPVLEEVRRCLQVTASAW